MQNYYGRIISGLYKGKKMLLPNIATTRPTTDRVKETMFNVLQHSFINNLQGNVLDAFAGSGLLGIEALSRGSNSIYLVENNTECIKTITKNVQSLYNYNLVSSKINIINSNILQLKPNNINKIDLLILDAPYNSNLVIDSFNYLSKINIFNSNLVVVVLSNTQITLNGLKNIVTKSTVKTKIQFFK